MQANLENLSQLERRLSVSVPMGEIDTEIENRLKQLSRTVKMHGFRPGKVPFKVVQQQYGPQVRNEVLGDMLQRTFGDAVRQQNLRVAGYPQFDAKPAADGAQTFDYTATFEVYPEVAVGDLSSAKVERPSLSVGDTELDHTLEIMRKQRVTFEPADRAAANGDQVRMAYKGTIDGTEFPGGAADDFPVVLGEGRLLPDFEKNVVGLKKGESRTFELKFPDDYHGKEVAGKTASFTVTVNEVGAAKLPAVDADFAKALGIADGDVAKMRDEVKANLEREVKARIKARVKDQVMQALLDNVKIETPKALVAMEVDRMREMAKQDFAARGMKVDDMPFPADVFEKQAHRRVTLGLILGEIVRANSLQAKPEQVRAQVEEQAQTYEKPDEVVKWFYQSPERVRDIEAYVVEENVVSWVLGKVKVEEKAADFQEFMGQK